MFSLFFLRFRQVYNTMRTSCKCVLGFERKLRWITRKETIVLGDRAGMFCIHEPSWNISGMRREKKKGIRCVTWWGVLSNTAGLDLGV